MATSYLLSMSGSFFVSYPFGKTEGSHGGLGDAIRRTWRWKTPPPPLPTLRNGSNPLKNLRKARCAAHVTSSSNLTKSYTNQGQARIPERRFQNITEYSGNIPEHSGIFRQILRNIPEPCTHNSGCCDRSGKVVPI